MGFAKTGISKFLKFGGMDHRWIGQAILGKKTAATIDPLGQVLGDYDSLYKPKDVQPIPTENTDAAAINERDIARRRAMQANGRDSTIRTSPAGALYSGTPKSLLGS